MLSLELTPLTLLLRFITMPIQSISAHYDGSHIVLDEATELRPDARLIVTVLPDPDPDRADFMRLSEDSLSQAYSDEEVEYSETDIKK